ncbi:HAMP domain-containing protein [Sediminibacillus dalangtanensis]|uniref:histidine kinase n=1 Tax=Sediminibacillus dalangtanensis TaxID=2729421 RepID=A0ABX7VNR5_9BACI|nr:HAMP domain-containing sensor histidine kinase [Sediminibacillus dalangtanensis]QTM98088.1 HAMP domain-containing protein [Sediminibacillus dalangtanensis]
MKLQSQLNIAFTTLLVVIMSVAAFTIYSLILNLLIHNEQTQLEKNGRIITGMINESPSLNMQQLSGLLEDLKLQGIFYYRSGGSEDTIITNLPRDVAENWVNNYDLSQNEQPLWKAGNERYVVSRMSFSPRFPAWELILVTPLNDLQAVQRNFIGILLIVFVVGILVAVLLSYYMTNRLVTPLTRLKEQVKKIEKRQFNEIQSVNASGEIKEVEESVMEMAQELERYIQSQRQFFQNASHELKTPLMTIQGYAEGIRDGVFEREESERGFEVMVAEIGRLKKIINEMILLAKLDSEENIYREENIKAADLIKLTMERALPLANERNVKLDTSGIDDATLTADKEKLLQAMMNIVANAIRHANSVVTVSVEKVDGVIIRVADDGAGVPPDLMPHLFHRFVKGEGGETGLGLAISRAIIERSGGRITVGSSESGGALFSIHL